MMKHFLTLEWKEFIRASYFQKGLVIKILLFLALLYFGGMAIFMGAILFFALKKFVPAVDPVIIVNNFMIHWLLLNLLVRFFMQQLPVMNIKPLMTIPIKRNVVIHYLLGKTAMSFFNFVSLFIFLPFSIVLLFNDYPIANVTFWFVSVMCLTMVINFINFLINKNNAVFYTIATVLAAFIALEYFGIFKVSGPFGLAFNALYDEPYLVAIPIILMIALSKINFDFVKRGFSL
ncbi:MAG: DUF5687 family protein, partial [Desulfobulbia bacterium]